MESDTKQLVQQQIKQWAQYLLIDEICNSNRNDTFTTLPQIYSPDNLSDCYFRIGQFLNPCYMPAISNQDQASPYSQTFIQQCIQNSHRTQNLSLLLNSVQQLPKLRYQPSSKVFQPKNQLVSTKQLPKQLLDPLGPTQSNPQALFQKQTKNTTNITNCTNEFPHLKTTESKHQSNSIFQYSTNHRIIDLEDISNQQNEIEANMSVRSYCEVHVTREDGNGQNNSDYSNAVRQSKKYEHSAGNQRNVHEQSESRAKQQRSMIQNYFESAKNRVLQNCGINCCEGIFQDRQETNQSKNFQAFNLKYGQQLTENPFKRK